MTFIKGNKINLGRKLSLDERKRLSEAHKGYKHTENSRKKLSEANKGQVPWIKGKHHTENAKLKISLGNKGKFVSEETRIKYSKINKGRVRSEDYRKRNSESHKNQIPWCAGKKLSNEHKRNIANALKGAKSPFWKGGISFLPYCSKFNKELKERIRERDEHVCQLCGSKENGKKLAVHHIHYDKPNCDPDLITLCNNCNSKVNSNRDYYETLFMNNLKNRDII